MRTKSFVPLILLLWGIVIVSCSTSKKDTLIGDWYSSSDSILVLSVKNDILYYSKHLANNQGFNSYTYNQSSNSLSVFLRNRYDCTKIDTLNLVVSKLTDNQLELSTDYINPYLVLVRNESLKNIKMQDFKEISISTYYCLPDKILDIRITSDGNVFFCGYSRTMHKGSFTGKLNYEDIDDIKRKLWYHKTDSTMRPHLMTDILMYKIEIIKTTGEKVFKEVYYNDNQDYLAGISYIIDFETILNLIKTDSVFTFSTRDYSRLKYDRERKEIEFLN